MLAMMLGVAAIASELVPVVFLASPVAPNTPIRREQVYVARMDEAHRPPGTVATVDAVVGRVARAPLWPGTPVRVERLADADVDGLDLLLRSEERLVRVPLDPVRMWPEPGGRVDVLRLDGVRSCVLARAARVLAGEAEDGTLHTSVGEPSFVAVHLAVSAAAAGAVVSAAPESVVLVERHATDLGAVVPGCGGLPEPLVSHRSERPRRRSGRGATVLEMLRGENAFLGELRLPAGARVPSHRDPTEEYLVVLEGQGIVTIDGTAHPIEAGSVVYMPARAKVSFVNGAVPLRAFQVFAGPEPADKYADWTLLPGPSGGADGR